MLQESVQSIPTIMPSKSPDSGEPENSESFKFFGLGGCNEVGRSCHIVEYKNKVIMLDAGVHPGLTGFSSLPFYDEYDLSKVDILLISHFHLDHAGTLPYVMQHSNFKGRVFMTHATKAIYRWLLQDFVRVTSIGNGRTMDSGANGLGRDGSSNLYTDDDLIGSFDKIETVDYHSTMEIDGIRFTAYHAGHVLGACMYLIEIGGLKILFTGDYSREEDRHLQVAEVPPSKPDILITESTFGTATHEPRLQKEHRMTQLIHSTLLKGGRVLMPVFALGRAQELLLILEEYWSQNEDLQNINIFYASSLARKCMAVYQTYTSIMNDKIRQLTSSSGEAHNPFDLKFIKSIRSLEKFQDMGPCVVVASPGMLQNGVSRELLEKWAPDPKNAVIMTGYSVEGTMAKDLLSEPHSIPSIANPEISIPRRLLIEEISFAAHVDFQQNAEFIDEVNPLKIILVHGESNPMGRLKSALLSKYSSRKGTENEVNIFNPRNCDELKIPIKGQRVATVLGTLAEEEGNVLRQEVLKVIAEEELKKIEEILEDEDDDELIKVVPPDENETEAKKTEKEKESTETTNVISTGKPVAGVLVSKDFDLNLLKLHDLSEFTQLSTSIVKSKINLKLHAQVSLVRWHLEQMFGYIEIVRDDKQAWECLIMNLLDVFIDLSKSDSLLVTVEWINDNLIADSLADSVVAILYSVDSSPASVKLTSKQHEHVHVKDEPMDEVNMIIGSEPKAHMKSDILTRVSRITTMLDAQFGDSIKKESAEKLLITVGKNEARINLLELTVACPSKVLRDRIETIIRRGCELAAPLAQFEKDV